MPEPFDEFRASIRRVLLADWDPHNAERLAEASGSYDGYVEPLATLIAGGADEPQIIEWLHVREQESMCFPSLGTQRLQRVAQKLIRLKPDDAAQRSHQA